MIKLGGLVSQNPFKPKEEKEKKNIEEGLSKKSLENVDPHVIDIMHELYYVLTDAIYGKIDTIYKKASEQNKDWKPEYDKIKKIKKLVESLETGKIL